MNHLVRYFLPSQVRGGYRFDEAFSQVDDASFGQLADGPCPWLRLLRLSLKFPQSCRKISIILPELIRNSRAGGSELFRRQLFEKRPRENVRNSDLTPEFPWENVRNSDLTPEFLFGYEMKWGKAKVKPPTEWQAAYPEAAFALVNQGNYLEFVGAG